MRFIEISIGNEKVRHFSEKYLLDTYLIGDRISPIPGGHWSVEHAKRECEEGEKGAGFVSKKRVQLLPFFRYADLSLSGEEKRQRASW